jgi:anti-sigma B factor antagonist
MMAPQVEAFMQLTLNTKAKQGVVIIEANGRLVSGEECEAFRKLIRDLLTAEQNRILISLGDVIRVDSTGIGALVEAVILTAKEGGRIKLFNVPRLIRNILSTHRLLQAFDIFETEDEALASYATEVKKAAS